MTRFAVESYPRMGIQRPSTHISRWNLFLLPSCSLKVLERGSRASYELVWHSMSPSGANAQQDRTLNGI